MKKFSFNFKFLDRFRKKKDENPEETEIYAEDVEHQSESVDNDEEESPISFQEMKRPGLEDRTNPSVVLNDSQSEVTPKLARQNLFESADNLAPEEESEFESAESSEAFAEKTLGNYKLPTHAHQTENSESNPDEIHSNILYQIENTEQESSFDKTSENIVFQEMQPPGKPEGIKKFKFNFPSFKADSIKNFRPGKFDLKASLQKVEKLSWTEIIQKIFSPYSRRRIHNTFMVLLVISLTYLLGKSVALFTNRTTKIEIRPRSTIALPADTQDTTITDINKITATNLFNAKENEDLKPVGPKVNIAEIVCVEADRPATGQLKLLDTIVLQDSVKSVASVQVRGAQELINIREGEKVDNFEISKIQRMKLILKNLETGDCEYLASEKEDELNMASPIKVVPNSSGKIGKFKSMNPNIKNEGNSFKIKKNYRDQMVSKMSDILTQAKALQITNPDGSLCFKMTEVVPGSIYTQLNIQENDIICQINGRRIDNLNELMSMLGKIKEIDSMSIGLKRNGMTENLEYGFE